VILSLSPTIHLHVIKVKSNLQKGVEYTRSRTDSSFDDIPGMTNTDSSGSNVIDADGDVTMADCYMNQRDKENGTDDNEQYLKVTLNNHDEEEEEDEEEYYDEDEDDEEEFNPYLFIKSLPPYEYALPPGWKNRPKALPPADHGTHPICLVLDLDETLVHCTVEPVADADMIFPVEFNGMNYQVHVRCRPFLTEFLEAVSKKFEVVIFTASQQVYADKLLDKIDPGESYML
jgi:TFIIF-interacting CTD phosphatase-like protein